MGGWLSRESWLGTGSGVSKDLSVTNESGLDLNLWCCGGGPVVVVRAGETKHTKLPPHLIGKPKLQWQATLSLRGPGPHGLLVAGPWEQAVGTFDTTIQVKVPPSVDADVDQATRRNHPLSSPSGGSYPLTLAAFRVVVAKQLAFRERKREFIKRKARLDAKVQRRAAKTMQRVARTYLDRHTIECPICLDDVCWTATKPTCKARKHRICEPCVRQYVDTALGEGKLYVRCPGVACNEVFAHGGLKELASAAAFETYEGNMAANHTQRLADESDADFLAFCSEHARRCPACQVVIYRYAGCKHVACRCGHAFNWDSPEARIALDASA